MEKTLTPNEIQQYSSCLPNSNEIDLIGLWNFEEGNGSTVNDQTSNGHNGTINGATFSSDVPDQACELTTVNGCDSVAVLNLTINQADTSFTEVTACESYSWNDSTYTQSGMYFSTSSNDNYSLTFDGTDDYVHLMEWLACIHPFIRNIS